MLATEERVLEQFPEVTPSQLYEENPFYSCVICAEDDCRKEVEKKTNGKFGRGCASQILQVPVNRSAELSIN